MAKFAAMSPSWSDEQLKEDVGNLVWGEFLQELNLLTSEDLFCNKSASAPTLQGTDVSSLDLVASVDELGALSRSDEKRKEDDVGDLLCDEIVQELTSGLFCNKSTSAPTQQDTDVSFLELVSLLDESITDSPRTVPHNIANGSSSSALSLGSKILRRYSQRCFQMFYIRQDRQGYLWVYPDLGGPYRSIADVDFAISNFQALHSQKGIVVESDDKTTSRDWNLIQALVDQYNEDHGHSEDGALELEDVVTMEVFVENGRLFYHLNFTATQGIAGKKLFFAEVSCKQRTKLMEVNCFCMINANDDGSHCFGCTNYGNPFVKHPKATDVYTGGHLDVPIPFIMESATQDDGSESEVEVESVEMDSESEMEESDEESKEVESEEDGSEEDESEEEDKSEEEDELEE